MLLTDGITEARRGPEILGDEGLTGLVLAAVTQTAGDFAASADALLSGARAFSGGPLRDDACLLLARRR